MRIKEYCFTWPPSRVGDIAAPPADVEDTVLRIQKCANAKGLLRLTLRNRICGEYEAALLVPKSFQEQIIFTILRRENMKLREVGELPIAKSAFVEPVSIASQPKPAANWAESFSSIADAIRQRPGRVIIKFVHSILLFFRLG